MQLQVFGSFPFPAGCWAREARAENAIVVWIADPIEAIKAGLGKALRTAEITSLAAVPLGTGCAYLLKCSPEVHLAILQQLPKPKSQGSRTAGNLLPW